MLDEVRRFVRREALLAPGQSVLVGVSGGVDSMVLLHLLLRLEHPCEVVHIDHDLRGAESDDDREHVRHFCAEAGVPLHVFAVDVRTLAATPGTSVQMAARTLRYERFALSVERKGWPLALAHHADDAVETLFLNMLRGAGAQGWASIPPKQGAFVRPLLDVSRAMILEYARANRILFREDSSNADPKYLRNRVRNELVPMLAALRPGALGAITGSLPLLREMTALAQARIAELIASFPLNGDGPVDVPFDVIHGSGSPLLLLHALLRHRGFHPSLIDRVRDAMDTGSVGSEFVAQGWRVLVDRGSIRIDRGQAAVPSFFIEEGEAAEPQGFSVERTTADRVDLSEGRTTAWLDAEKLVFPLEFRPWRAGDRMRPIGLNGTKLVSDILIDAKIPQAMKELTYVLVSAEEIVWLAGHRVARGYEATSASGRVLRIHQVAN